MTRPAFRKAPYLTLLALMIFSACVVTAQVAKVKVRLERESPYETIRTFLLAMQPESYRPDIAAQTIDFKDIRTASERRDLARRLKTIMDGMGLIVQMDQVPRDTAYVDSASGGHIYLLFPGKEDRISLERNGRVWLFSRETVAYIPEMYEELYPYGLDRAVEMMPHDWPIFFGIESWKILGLAVLLVSGFFIGWVLGTIGLWVLNLFFRRWGASKSTGTITHKAVRPMAFGLAFLLTEIALPILQLPVGISRPILFSLRSLGVICVIVIAFRLSDLIWFRLHQRADLTEGQMDDALIPLAEKTGKFLIVLFGLIVLLQTWEFNVMAVLAGVSIGGVALAFAAQDTIKHLFGSVMIFLDKPFQIGDWIIIDGQEGAVESIGFRSTRIRTFANSVLYVPNGKLADMNIDNMGLRQYRRYNTYLGLQYDTPPEKMEAFLAGIKKIVDSHPHVVQDPLYKYVAFHVFESSSLNILVRVFFDVPDWTEELKAREEINLALLRLAAEVGVSYAFPTRTVHVVGSGLHGADTAGGMAS